mmetsp:Transcript_18868/g.28635  ORF Transcript_18868/g.28635 Transcript_18868/m.28635 type:complete len:85 (-) Transcript_18868:487-741(-)
MPIPEPTFLACNVQVPGGRFVFIRLMVPERITEPVRRQIAVSKPPSSSASSVRLSRPFTRLTILYNSTNDLGSFTKQLKGAPGR